MIMMCLSCAVLAAWLAVLVPRRRGSFGTGSPPQRMPSLQMQRMERGSDAGDDYGPYFAFMIILLGVIIAVGPSRQRKGCSCSPVQLCWLE